MSVDKDTVRWIAKSARLPLKEAEVERICKEINTLLDFDEQLNEVDIDGVLPLTSVITDSLKMRKDEISVKNQAEVIVANAPLTEDNFFLVPKVVD